MAKTQKERLVSQPPNFRGENVGFREGNHLEALQGGPLLLIIKWSYNPYQWLYKYGCPWLIGVISPQLELFFGPTL